MRIEELDIRNWRNIEEERLRPAAGMNVLVGRNAQGKTNIIETVEYATLLRSRARKEEELIRYGAKIALVVIKYVKSGVLHELEIELTTKRKIKLDGKEIRPRELIGKINSVQFTPEDILMFRSAPLKRRKYLDAQISQVSASYFDKLLRYNRVLEIRNELLRRIRAGLTRAMELEIWDEQLASLNEELVRRRLEVVLEMNELASRNQRELTSGAEELEISYKVSGDIKELLTRRAEDIRRGNTSVGAHRDDLEFRLNGRELKKYGSQGQLRTAALSLKLSELEYIEGRTGTKPLLVLDDVMSELDSERRERLIEYIGAAQIQTFITSTERISSVKNYMEYEVAGGRVNARIFTGENAGAGRE